jgi:hypothetical protein
VFFFIALYFATPSVENNLQTSVGGLVLGYRAYMWHRINKTKTPTQRRQGLIPCYDLLQRLLNVLL